MRDEPETPAEHEPEQTDGCRCIKCGGLLAAVLARLGSTHCHDCRTVVLTVARAA